MGESGQAARKREMLLGRGAEIDELLEVIDQARVGGSTALVIRGDAGIGKTGLLNELISRANDFELIRVDGVESELQFGYAALHRIVLPFMGRLGYLPIPQRDALESAFGMSATGLPDRFLVGLATLALLGDIERTSPLLIVVDDAHWLDLDSVAALEFVGRRLVGDRMVIVCTVREMVRDPPPFQGWRELPLRGLEEDSSHQLLLSLAKTPIQRRVATELVVAAEGNPLAIRGFVQELSTSQLAGLSPLPDPLPTGDLIEARFARQAEALPGETRTALLLAAAEPSGDPATIAAAASELGISLASLEPAESIQLIRTHPRIEFSHPLVRSAIYSGASLVRRREVHQALASATDRTSDGERWAMHRALASLGPDEDIALALEESATQARKRGGYSAETTLLLRSADLTPRVGQRSRRLLLAAYAAYHASNPSLAEILLNDARGGDLGLVDLAHAALLDGMIQVHIGRTSQSPALLQQAAETFSAFDTGLSHQAFLSALLAQCHALDLAEGTTGRELGEAALRSLRETETDSTVDILLRGMASLFACDIGEAAPALHRALAHFDRMSAEEVIKWFEVATFIAYELCDAEASRAAIERLEGVARQQGAILALRHALIALGVRETRQGNFSAASERFAEFLDLRATPIAAVLDLELDAWRGDETAARVKIAELLSHGTAIGGGWLLQNAHLASATLELGLGNYPEALAAAEALHAPRAPGWSCWALPLVVEAAVRCGDETAAKRAFRDVEEIAAVVQTPWAFAIQSLCRAQIGEESSEIASSFHDAITRFEEMQWRSFAGRAHLLYGEWLRRAKRRAEARDELRAAHEIFETVGARAFAERARIELQAIGVRTKRRNSSAPTDLTSRELHIARLAATRLTTREIASQLFISPHTVEYHLRKVFQKLGIVSRRDLATAIERIDLEAGGLK
jgi:DNA-binding CsgD family transcriptional regulator